MIEVAACRLCSLSRPGTRLGILLLLVAALAGCVSAESWEATRLLADIDAGAAPSALKQSTPRPSRTTLHYSVEGRPGVADLYAPQQPPGGALVLVPGFTELGRNDARVVDLAHSLARARFLVLVPDIPGSRQLRVRPEDSRDIADAVIHLRRARPQAADQGLGVVAISYAVGLAVLAADPGEAESVPDYIVGLGGYYDTAAVVTFATTGSFRLPGAQRWRRGETLAAAKWVFLAGNIALLDSAADRQRLEALAERCRRGCDLAAEGAPEDLGPDGRALWELMANDNPELVPRLLAALPAAMKAQMDLLSLSRRDLAHLSGRLILIHGRLDPLIPYSESLALARAVPGSEVFLIDGFSHIAPRGVDWAGQLQLVDALQAVLRRRGAQ